MNIKIQKVSSTNLDRNSGDMILNSNQRMHRIKPVIFALECDTMSHSSSVLR